MGLRTRTDRLERRLRRATRGADGHTAVQQHADRFLRERVAYDVAAWATVDPASVIPTSCWLAGAAHDAGREQAMFELEYSDADVNRYSRLVRDAAPAATLHAATGGEKSTSRRFRTLLEPAGLTDELRAVCLADRRCWGTITLYRRAGRPPFTDGDVDTVAAVAPVVADLLRRSFLRQAAGRPDSMHRPPGVLVVDDAGELSARTVTGGDWLEHGDGGQLPSAARSVASRARSEGSAAARLALTDGTLLVLHGSPVDGRDGGVAVIVEAARPIELTDVIVDALGLTSREREVVGEVLQGRTNEQAAARLDISPWTVQDHLKAVFDKAGVNSRGELAALLHRRHYRPQIRAGAVPGPYGWFLDH